MASMTRITAVALAATVAVAAGFAARAADRQPPSDAAQESLTRYVRFEHDGRVAYGIYQDDQTVRQIDGDLFGKWERTDRVFPLADVKLLVPCKPSKVIGMATNYRSHATEAHPVPEKPQAFFKLPSCLIADGQPIELPPDSAHVDAEAEMVVVIGRRAENVSIEEARQCVLGVTCGNDVTARKWQANDQQWWRAKGSDTFGPVGPWIVTGLDYGRLDLTLRVNGKVRQKVNTDEMAFSIPECISHISRYITLEPGDLIFTGTPGRTPTLSPGDRVSVELEGVGVLRNPVVARPE